MTRIPDAAERARALHPETSFLVQAPAGSGKTELLIQRFLTLLARVDRPEAVLAITFTEKAAGEMRQRVVEALRDSAAPRPDADHAAVTWELARAVRSRSDALGWDLFLNPNRLEIRTIDSLCASLVRRMPWLSRLGAPPEIADRPEDLYADAAQQTIELLESGCRSDAVEALLVHLDNDFRKLQDLLARLLARRDQWLRHVAGPIDPAAARAALEAALQNAIRDGVDRVRALLPAAYAAEFVAVVEEATGAEDPWLAAAGAFLTEKGDWRKRLTAANGFPPKSALKTRAEDLIAALAPIAPLRAALADLRWLPTPAFSETQWTAMQALVELLPLAVAQLALAFAQAGQTDYAEISLAAQRALGEPEAPTDLALSLDYRIQHLLVDEFQDTSVSQYTLIEKLTWGWQPGDGRTLFVVGDPMQSIYRFREAEVGLFLKAGREGIGAVRLERLRLTANFRSDAQLVDWVNATFPAVLPPAENMATSAIPFAASIPVKPERDGAAVRIHPFIGRDDAAEAERAAALTAEARARGAKVAILVRARSHLAAIVPALRAAGLRYRAVEIDALAAQPLILDLTSLTRALLHPADRIAWLAVLRAPWCGLTLADLYAIAADAPDSPVWDLISDDTRAARLDEASRERLIRFREAIRSAVMERASALRAKVEGAWLAIGGPACAAGPADRENAAAFFDLLEEMDADGRLDPAALAARVEQLYATPDPGADDGIQVMSIHKAKGLQFEVVIVPGLGRKTRSEEARLLLWLERPRLSGDADLLMSPIHAAGADEDPIYRYLRKTDAIKGQHEAGRLLYVAATRAKSELHLLGHAEFDDDRGVLKTPDSTSLLGRMWDAARPEFERALAERPVVAETETAAPERAPRSIERLTMEWTRPAPPPAAASPDVERSISPAENVAFRWVGDTLRHIGTVVHQMLRRIAEDGPDAWSGACIEQSRGAFRSALLSLGVPPADVAEAAGSVAAALDRALADPRGAWLLRGGDESACEFPLTGVLSGEIVQARADRTFVDADGTRWIVDYKTSAHEGGSLEAFLDAERDRYRAQLDRYRRLFTALDGRPVRTALYFPLLGGWREVGAVAATHSREDA